MAYFVSKYIRGVTPASNPFSINFYIVIHKIKIGVPSWRKCNFLSASQTNRNQWQYYYTVLVSLTYSGHTVFGSTSAHDLNPTTTQIIHCIELARTDLATYKLVRQVITQIVIVVVGLVVFHTYNPRVIIIQFSHGSRLCKTGLICIWLFFTISALCEMWRSLILFKLACTTVCDNNDFLRG